MDCFLVNLKNVTPPFFKFTSVYITDGNIEAVFLKLGTINVHHKKKHNDTLNAVAMATVWPLVLSY